MISDGFQVTAKDFGYELEFTVRDQAGDVVNLTGVTDVKLKVAELGTNRKLFEASAAVAGAPIEGKVKYTVQTGDFTKRGNYIGTLTLVFGTGKEFSSAPIHISVNKNIG